MEWHERRWKPKERFKDQSNNPDKISESMNSDSGYDSGDKGMMLGTSQNLKPKDLAADCI